MPQLIISRSMIETILTKRVAAFVIDLFICMFVVVVLSDIEWLVKEHYIAFTVITLLVFVAIPTLFISLHGRTLGMKLMKLKFSSTGRSSNSRRIFFVLPFAFIITSFFLNWISLYLANPDTDVFWFKVGYFESEHVIIEILKTTLTVLFITLTIPFLIFRQTTAWELISRNFITDTKVETLACGDATR